MDAAYKRFYKLLDDNLKDTINKNIIIYGCNRGGDFIRWFYKTYYKKEIKTFVDRWELSKETTIPHLWAFYYIYDQNDIIINVTLENIIEEFNDTGEDWNKTLYRQEQIVNLWDKIYKVDDKDEYPQITYFEWLEYTWGIDLTGTIKRKFTAGEESHGYFPTEFRFFVDGLKDFTINESDAVLDIGSGKGSGIFSLLAAGFRKAGGVEYTDYIFKKMDDNLNSVGLSHLNVMAGEMENELDKNIVCYQGDATLM